MLILAYFLKSGFNKPTHLEDIEIHNLPNLISFPIGTFFIPNLWQWVAHKKCPRDRPLSYLKAQHCIYFSQFSFAQKNKFCIISFFALFLRQTFIAVSQTSVSHFIIISLYQPKLTKCQLPHYRQTCIWILSHILPQVTYRQVS